MRSPSRCPRLGESVTEGTVTRWLKKEGEQVEADEPLLEVSTDKVDTEIPSPASGMLQHDPRRRGRDRRGRRRAGRDRRRRPAPPAAEAPAAGPAGAGAGARAGARAPQQPGEPQPAPEPEPEPQPQPAPEPQQPAAQPRPAAGPAPQRPRRSPRRSRSSRAAAPPPAPQPAAAAPRRPRPAGRQAGRRRRRRVRHAAGPQARRRARRRPAARAGTGVGGRIRKQDVLDAAGRQAAARRGRSPPAARAAAAAAAGRRRGAPQARAEPPLRGRTEKLSRLRAVIATRMVESLQVSAQLTTVVEVDVTRIARLRAAGQGRLRGARGRQAVVPAVLRAGRGRGAQGAPERSTPRSTSRPARSPTTTPSTSASRSTPSAACSCRSSTTPATSTSAAWPARSPTSPSAPAPTRSRPDELGGGTFTLTNTGSRGALFDTPIINQPQVGILGTGAVVKRAGRRRRPGPRRGHRGPVDGLPGADLRPPARRRRRRGPLPDHGQGAAGGRRSSRASSASADPSQSAAPATASGRGRRRVRAGSDAVKIAVTGASGLIGAALRAGPARRRPRGAPAGPPHPAGPPTSTAGTRSTGALDPAALAGVDAVVNLAGVGDRRPALDRRATSRPSWPAGSTPPTTAEALAAAAAADPAGRGCCCPPRRVGYYGDTGDTDGRRAAPGRATTSSPERLRAWEAATAPAEDGRRPGRAPAHRPGLAAAAALLGRCSAAVPARARRPARRGPAVLALDRARRRGRRDPASCSTADVSGPVNLTGPEPVTNAEFTKAARPGAAPAGRAPAGAAAGAAAGARRVRRRRRRRRAAGAAAGAAGDRLPVPARDRGAGAALGDRRGRRRR